MGKLIEECEGWSESLKSELNESERESFKRHLELFRKHFLVYAEQKDSTPSSHTGKDSLSSLDFISKWQRFEAMHLSEIE